MTLLTAIIINPIIRTVSAEQIEPGLQGMYKALSIDPAWSGTVERVEIDNTHDLWLDENGCLEPGRFVFRIGEHPIAGVAMVLAHDDEGESVSCTTTVAAIAAIVRWTNAETTGGDFIQGHSEDTPKGFVIYGPRPRFRERS